MPRLDWRLIARALAGFAVGLAIWMFASPLYDRGISRVTETIIRAFERPPVTHLRPAEDEYVTVDRTDFDPRSKRPSIPVRDLTFNFILLVALFAASKRPFSDRNIGGFLIAAGLLAITHVLATITEVEALYALKLGLWSNVRYSAFERNFWGVANHFYRLVLMYAIAFSLWWIFRAPDAQPAKKSKRRK